jgi:hypothetical protein
MQLPLNSTVLHQKWGQLVDSSYFLDSIYIGGADKSLARPTSRCRRTESIVSLEIHAILRETLGEHAPSYATVKNWVAQFKRGDFYNCPPPRRAKDLSAPRYWNPRISVRKTIFVMFAGATKQLSCSAVCFIHVKQCCQMTSRPTNQPNQFNKPTS